MSALPSVTTGTPFVGVVGVSSASSSAADADVESSNGS